MGERIDITKAVIAGLNAGSMDSSPMMRSRLEMNTPIMPCTMVLANLHLVSFECKKSFHISVLLL